MVNVMGLLVAAVGLTVVVVVVDVVVEIVVDVAIVVDGIAKYFDIGIW